MLQRLFHYGRLALSKIREHQKSKERSPRWNEVRDAFLQIHPLCVACGGIDNLQVHHIVPFALRPDLELEHRNLLTLCMGPKDCHLMLGHAGSFAYYNANVVHDAHLVLRNPLERALIESKAKERRRFLVVKDYPPSSSPKSPESPPEPPVPPPERP